MKKGNVLLGLLLVFSIGFLASALLYAPPEGIARSPADIQTYCKEKMKDKPVILCTGSWELDPRKECRYVCGTDPQNVPSLGGDRDERSCKGSAGYSWCESKQRCIRMWEEDCMCGGIAGYACPVGYGCNATAEYLDASGSCTPEY